MVTPLAYGIDFGTSNSALAAAFDDGTCRVLSVDESDSLFPSQIHLHRNGNRLAGRQAVPAFLATGTDRTRCRGCSLVDWVDGKPLSECLFARRNGFCMDARLLSQVKSFLSDQDLSKTHSWGVDFHLEELVAIVLRQLKQSADRITGASVERLVLGHPVRFAGAEGLHFVEAQALAMERLRRAAELAGFTEIALVPESQAAVAIDDIENGMVVCTDFGGGTFDVAVVQATDDAAITLALDGVAVGGEDFDAQVFDAKVRAAIGLDAEFSPPLRRQTRLPAGVRSHLRSLSGLSRYMASDELGRATANLRGGGHDDLLDLIGELVYGGQAVPFYEAIEQAKIRLSKDTDAVIEFRRPSIHLRVPISRDEFEEIIASDLQLVRLCMQDACAAANVDPAQVSYVTKTGGSSQIVAFDRLTRELFPRAHVVERDPFNSVVTGLAEYAQEEWGNG